MSNPISNIARLLHAGFVLARYDALIPPEQLTGAPWIVRTVLKIAKFGRSGVVTGGQLNQLTAALTQLGPSYIKLGQFLATRPDIIGAKRAYELKALQDRLPPFADAQARKIVETELGKPMAQLFKIFGPAIAAASIAQVHKCLTFDGREVAVKILRPNVEKRFANDLNSYAFAARMAERRGLLAQLESQPPDRRFAEHYDRAFELLGDHFLQSLLRNLQQLGQDAHINHVDQKFFKFYRIADLRNNVLKRNRNNGHVVGNQFIRQPDL